MPTHDPHPVETIRLSDDHSIELYKSTTKKHGRQLFDMILVSDTQKILIPYNPIFIDDDWWNVGVYDGCDGYITKTNDKTNLHNINPDTIDAFVHALSSLLENKENVSRSLITTLQQASNPLSDHLHTSPKINNTSEIITSIESDNSNLHQNILHHIDNVKTLSSQYNDISGEISQYQKKMETHRDIIQLRNNKTQAQKKLHNKDAMSFETNKTTYIEYNERIEELYQEHDKLSKDLDILQQAQGSKKAIKTIQKEINTIRQSIDKIKEDRNILKKTLLLSPSLSSLVKQKMKHVAIIKKIKKTINLEKRRHIYEQGQFDKYNRLCGFIKDYNTLKGILGHIKKGGTNQSLLKKLKTIDKNGRIDVSGLIQYYPPKNQSYEQCTQNFTHALGNINHTMEKTLKNYETMTGFTRMRDRYDHICNLKAQLLQITNDIQQKEKYIGSHTGYLSSILTKLTNTYNKQHITTPGAEYTWKNIGKNQLSKLQQRFHDIDHLINERNLMFRNLSGDFRSLQELNHNKQSYQKKIKERQSIFDDFTDRHKKRIRNISKAITTLNDTLKTSTKHIRTTNKKIEKELQNTSLNDIAGINITATTYQKAQHSYNSLESTFNQKKQQQSAIKKSIEESYNIEEHIMSSEHIITTIEEVISHHHTGQTNKTHITHDYDRIRNILFSLDDNIGSLNTSLSNMPHNSTFLHSYKKDIRKLRKKIERQLDLLS